MSRVTTQLIWNGDEFKKHIEDAASRGLGLAGVIVQQEMIRRLSGTSPSAPGSAPGVDTGALRRSITVRRSGKSVEVGTNLPYGRWLEFGANPRARGKLMPVPLNRRAKLDQRRVKSLRQIPGLFVVHRGTNVFLARKKGGKGIEFMYVLKKSVRIAPRPWLRPSVQAALPRAQAKVQEVMTQAIASFAGRAA